MATRWFLVTLTTDVTGGTRPKYWDASGIEGYAGQDITVNGTDYFAVRFRGTTSALDSIESNSDAASIQESGYSKSDVAAYLNDKTGHEYSFSEWEERFLTGSV